MKLLTVLLLCLLVAGGGLAGCAHQQTVNPAVPGTRAQTSPAPTPTAPVDPAVAAIDVRAEKLRADCIIGRRLICGRVLQIATNGLVVDSGYTDLVRPPLDQSWIVPGSVSVHRDPDALELNEPGSPCMGLIFLTDIPKRKKAKQYDYVVIIGYPAGQYAYTPLPGVEKRIRKFAAGLESAVRMRLQAEEKK